MSAESSIWLKYRPSKKVLLLLKAAVGGLLIWFLYSKISAALAETDVLKLNFSSDALFYFSMAIGLTFFNWFFEARKWQILASPFENLSLKTAYQSVLSGLATGLITPNRLGNFIGRLIYIKPENRVQGTVNTQLGNLAQFIVSISLGIIGLAVSLFYVKSDLNPWLYGMLPIGMLMLAIALYFNPKLLLKLPFGKKIYDFNTKTIDDLLAFPANLKVRALGNSALRYVVFLIQYYCLFQMFGIDNGTLLIIALSATTFLITTVVPGVFMGKLLVRESAAVFVFSWIALPVQIILAVSFLLWLINLAIPSVLGWLFWLKKSAK
ncbi:MAG: lysylphosphatidylglycerol synthase domain-containing protein [Crocinitomicaceae bacterium]